MSCEMIEPFKGKSKIDGRGSPPTLPILNGSLSAFEGICKSGLAKSMLCSEATKRFRPVNFLRHKLLGALDLAFKDMKAGNKFRFITLLGRKCDCILQCFFCFCAGRKLSAVFAEAVHVVHPSITSAGFNCVNLSHFNSPAPVSEARSHRDDVTTLYHAMRDSARYFLYQLYVGNTYTYGAPKEAGGAE